MPPGRPQTSEYLPYYEKYVQQVNNGDILRDLASQIRETVSLLSSFSDDASLNQHPSGKWTLRETVGHLIDTEQVFAYRALRFARNDQTPLPGFDPNAYVPAAKWNRVPWHKLIEGYAAFRTSTVNLFETLDPDAWTRQGLADGNSMSVRALAYIIAGHELHHAAIIRADYLPLTVATTAR